MLEKNTDFEIGLPMVNVKEENVLDVLITLHDSSEPLKDGVLKIQTWIMNFAEEQIAPLRESGEFTEDEIDAIKRKMCVISPLTLSLYTHWFQMEQYIKMPDSEKERVLMEKMPDRFKARFRGNASNRQAREVATTEEIQGEESGKESSAEQIKRMQNMTFVEFLKELGRELGDRLRTKDGKAA